VDIKFLISIPLTNGLADPPTRPIVCLWKYLYSYFSGLKLGRNWVNQRGIAKKDHRIFQEYFTGQERTIQ